MDMERIMHAFRDHDIGISRVSVTRVHALRRHQDGAIRVGRKETVTDFGDLVVVSRCAVRVLVSEREKRAPRLNAR